MMNSEGNSIVTTGAINIGGTMMSDAMSDEPSSPESTTFDDSDLLNHAVHDDVTAQLAAAGPIGMAAAAAIATGKKRKRPHSFETNPSIRKRQQTRLLRKLKATIEEYTTRVGQQAIVLCVTPGKPNQSSNSFKAFGSQPLENVIRNSRGIIMQDLENCLAQQAPPHQPDNPALHELPPLVIDGIPTPVDKMTQAQLRAFIPEMLKYSTGRSKPGWGKPECRPVWWPNDVPWANVRSDVRSEEEKKKVSWTHALRTIVKNCYKHHGRDDLMPEFEDSSSVPVIQHAAGSQFGQQTMVQAVNNPDGTVSIIQIDTGDLQNTQVVTLPDGTQAHVVHTVGHNGQPQQEATQAVQTLAEVAATHHDVPQALQTGGMSIQVNTDETHTGQSGVATLAEATINSDGQLVLTGDASAFAGNAIQGMVTIPVSMYNTVVSNIAQMSETRGHQAAPVQIAMTPNSDINDAIQVQLQQVGNQLHIQEDPHQQVSEQPHEQDMDTQEVEEGKVSTQSGDVPDATQAVEIVTVEPAAS